MKKNILKILKKNKYLKFVIPALVLLAIFSFLILKDLPFPTKLNSVNSPQSTQIFDRNGKLLYTIYANKNQTFLPLSQIPKNLQQATIAIEDKDFYKHGAIDIKGIIRAFIFNLTGHPTQGGSTLTQQLVKNSLLTPERTFTRKIKEIILSFATEIIYPKDKILEMYLNQIPYGGTSYGIEAASQTYFGKHVTNLDLAESALLAGLPEAPSVFSPFGSHPELAKIRQLTVLNAMQDENFIKSKEKDSAARETLHYQKLSSSINAPHFVLYVKDLLIKKYGEDKVLNGGLKVITSLDSNIQNFAQNAVASEVKKLDGYHATNGASIVTKPASGEILAMVGSKGYFDTDIDGNVNVTLSLRQPGSSIKPINYAVGLMHGYTGATPFVDQKICFEAVGRQKEYCPVNYDGKWHGVVQMRDALGNSINIPAIKMLKLNGTSSMIDVASSMGITTFTEPEKYGLSLTLGGGEVTMLDMTQAYGVFANGGYRINLHPILKVTDKNSITLEQYNPAQSPIFGKKVLPSDVAFIISDILADNNARLIDFGPDSLLKIPNKTVAVKTGTTNDFRDNWTIGYTPSFVVAAWVGNNDNSPMSSLASGITGAAPIWNKIMTYVLKDKPQEPLNRPNTVIQKKICAISGLLPPNQGTPNACQTRFEYFIKGTEPVKVDPGLQKVKIDKETNDLAMPGKTDNIDERAEVVVTDATGQAYCATCPHPTPPPAGGPTP